MKPKKAMIIVLFIATFLLGMMTQEAFHLKAVKNINRELSR